MTNERFAWLRSLAAAALVLAVSTAPSAARAAASDLWTTFEVKLDLLLAEGVDARDIDVDTADGLVTLHGVATSGEEKAKAESIARGTGDTRPVRNLIQVIPDGEREAVARNDDEIRRDLEAALHTDRDLGGVNVESVNQGVVVLEGRVGTLAAHLRAVEVAEGVSGVRHVASELRSPDRAADAEIWRDSLVLFEPPAEPLRDAWITAATKLSLLANDASGLDIDAHTHAGVVTLFGIVESERQKAEASALAAKIALVRGVRNNLQVVTPSERAAVEQRDAAIEPEVEQRLAADRELARAAIDVDVSNGVVWLEGDVNGRGERRNAITLARTTTGVRAVVAALDVETE